ncbi:MAG: hypothetical protein R6V67_10810 [Spirochaetia bacterium]
MAEKLRRKAPHIEKSEEEGSVYFTVFWSPLAKAEKFDIITKVPEMAGILELYYMDEHHRLFPMYTQRVWYGGLRSRLRRITDPELVLDQSHKNTLEKYSCYYRYTLTESMGDMLDLLYFFSLSYLPGSPPPEPSGRYENIFVEEVAPDKITDVSEKYIGEYNEK